MPCSNPKVYHHVPHLAAVFWGSHGLLMGQGPSLRRNHLQDVPKPAIGKGPRELHPE